LAVRLEFPGPADVAAAVQTVKRGFARMLHEQLSLADEELEIDGLIGKLLHSLEGPSGTPSP
jgi:hypothetical protein